MSQVAQIQSALAAEQLPAPSTAWIQALVARQTALGPAACTTLALAAAAKAQLLAADITARGLWEVPPRTFPPQLASASAGAVQEMRLAHDVVVQVVDLENLSQSRWQQVQALEAIERGEQKRGREIVRVAPQDDEPDAHTQSPNETSASAAPGRPDMSATHRLQLQDAAGQRVLALELVRIPRIAIGKTRIGEKMLLKAGTLAARGTLLLEPANTRLLGGQLHDMDDAWTKGQLARLRAAAQAGDGQ